MDGEKGENRRDSASSSHPESRNPQKRFRWEKPAVNVSALLTSTVVNRATRFLIYAMVGRTLGAADLGRLAIGFALLQLIGRGALLGLPILITREVAADRAKARSYLRTSSVASAAGSLVGYAVLFVLVFALGYDGATTRVIWLLFVGLIPFVVSKTGESVLIGLERARYVALANTPVNITQTAVVALLLGAGYGVEVIAAAMGLEFLAVAIIQVAQILRSTPGSPAPSATTVGPLIRDALPFLGMDWAIVLRASIAALVISAVAGEAAVGIFAAANQLQMPLRMAGQAMGTALFPVMVRALKRGTRAFERASGRVLGVLFMVVLPGATGLIVLAGDLLQLVYAGDEFAEGALALRILVVSGVAASAASVLGRTLVAQGGEVVTMRISLINTAASVPALLVLTSLFGVTGAASAVSLVALLNVVQHTSAIRKVFGSVPHGDSLLPTAAACLVMALVLVALGALPVVLSVLIGAATYAAALAVAMRATEGGWGGVRLVVAPEAIASESSDNV